MLNRGIADNKFGESEIVAKCIFNLFLLLGERVVGVVGCLLGVYRCRSAIH